METLKKMLYIPSNHRLQLNVTLSDTFPTGNAEIILIVAPKEPSAQKDYSQLLLKLEGSLKKSPHFSGDPLILQKALRDEWQR